MLETIAPSQTVALYPSSCQYSEDFQNLPHDFVILNSRGIRRERRLGKVLCLPYDNNRLLGILVRLRIRISTVVIIRDGCMEGGNYECITGDGFFGRLLPALADEFNLHCDHGKLPPDVPAQFERINAPDYLQIFIKNSDPHDTVSSYRGAKCVQAEKEFEIGRIRVRLFWDSLWSHVSESGLNVVRAGEQAETAARHYFDGLELSEEERARFIFVNGISKSQIEELLNRAGELALPRISFMPCGPRSYPRIVQALREWSGKHPCELCFYHLNAYDFRYFKQLG